MIRISTLNYNTDTLSDALYNVSTTQWDTLNSLSNKLTLSLSLSNNLFVGGTASIVSLNVNAGQIKNDIINGRVGINVGTANPSVPFDVVATPSRFRTLSANAFMEILPNVNNNGLATMFRFMTSPDGTLMDSSRIYFQGGNPTQPYSGDMYTRCANYVTDCYTTQSNNDATVAGLQGFTGARPIQYFNFINTVDTTRISANGFGMYVPYLSLSNLSHQVYPNVMAIGYSNGGTDPDVPFTLHCGSGSGTGDSYGGGLQVTNHNNYSQFTSRLPYDVAFRANGNATVTGSISANDFFVGGVSSVNTLFTSFTSLSGYVSSTVVSLLSLSNYVSNTVVSFLSLSAYTSTVNESLMSLSNYVSNTVVSFLSLSGYVSSVNESLMSLSNYVSNTVVSFLSLSNKLTLSLSLANNLFVGGTASIVSLNVNDGQIYNNTTNGRVGINTSAPQAAFDVVGTTRIRTLSNNAYMEFTPDVNSTGYDNMVRSLYTSGGTIYEGTRTYYYSGNPSQTYSGYMTQRCARNQLDIFTTQSNNDSSVLGLQGFTGARQTFIISLNNTVDTTRISAFGFGFYVPYVSLSDLSHELYGNVMATGFINGGTDPDMVTTLHCGSGNGTGDSYGGGLQVTNHNNYSLYTSRLPYDVAFRANGNATVTGSISANDFFVGGVSSVNTLFTSFVSLSNYVSSTVVSLLSLSNYVSNTVVSFLSLSGYTSTVNASLMSLSNVVSVNYVLFQSLSAYISRLNVSFLSLSNFVDSFTTGLNIGNPSGLATNTVISNTTTIPWFYNAWVSSRSSGEAYNVVLSSGAFVAGGGTGLRIGDRFETGSQATTYFVKLNFIIPPGWYCAISSATTTTFNIGRAI